MHQEFSTIADLIHYARNGGGQHGKGVYFIGSVTPDLALAIRQASGLEVAGYRTAIDHSAIVHIQRKHGQPTEVLQGQIPVSVNDIAQLADWLASPTRVADAGQKSGQPHCLRFELETSSALVLAILEVRPGRKRR